MRIKDTADHDQNPSGAVTLLIQNNARQGDVDSENTRRTLPTRAMPGIRTSTTATRIGTTRATTTSVPEQSADLNLRHNANHVDFSFTELVQAYLDCRKNKRNTASALEFEQDTEGNLFALYESLQDLSYRPGKSICFVITQPKPREVWAAQFRDRIVHHLLYNRISPRFHASFIADSCACIPGRGTLYAAERLEAKIRSITQNWAKPAYYLKCDLANFFVGIDKAIVYQLVCKQVSEHYWRWLTQIVLFHDPRTDYELRGNPQKLELVPPHKRLIQQAQGCGLTIGNLSSQFFANIYLNVLDQHIKHNIKARHYIRYVDDFILLHESAQWLNAALNDINVFLPAQLNARLNPKKTVLQPVDRGVDFVGQVIKPWHRSIRKRTFKRAIEKIKNMHASQLFAPANSYFGLTRQTPNGHHRRTKIAKLLMQRGYTINREITKTYRKTP